MNAVDIRHGTVMSHLGADRIPEAIPFVRERGLRFQHYGWPGVTLTQQGDVLVSASERIGHVDPFGRVVVSRSTDNGTTWSEPDVVFDSMTDDRDAALCTLSDGTVALTWFSSSGWAQQANRPPEWDARAERIGAATLRALSRGWLRRSLDGGCTWEEDVYPAIVHQHAGPTVLSDGALIQCGPFTWPDGPRVVAARSEDGGVTWSVVGEVPCGRFTHPETGRVYTDFNESHAIEIAPGRILCAFRGAYRPDSPGSDKRYVHLTRSDDGGRTWTPPEPIEGAYGFPPYLLRLAAGPILCLFSDRRGPWAIRGVLSYDDGRTWDTEDLFTVREFPGRVDMGYPSGVEVAPGEVLCVYYSVPVLDMTPDYETYDPAQAGILSSRIRFE